MSVNIPEPKGPLERFSVGQETEPLIRLQADLTQEGMYGTRYLEVTETELCVLDGSEVPTWVVPISDIKSCRNEPVVGGGRLEVLLKSGHKHNIISYTHTIAAKFSEAARGIEQLASGEPLLINLKEERMRCANCNRLLPEKDGVCPACVQRGKTLRRIANFLSPYKKQAGFLVLCSLATTALNLVPPYLQGTIIDEVLKPQKNLNLLTKFILIWLGVVVMSTVVQVLTGRLIAFLAGNIAADLRSAVYRAIEFLQIQFFDKKQVGAIASRVTHDTDRVWGFLVDGLPYLVTNALLMSGIIVFLFLTNARLALLVLIPLPLVLITSVIFWKPLSQLFHRVGQKWARFHIHLNESLNGIRVVKVFAKEDREYDKFLDRNYELRDSGVTADKRWFTIFGAMSFFSVLASLIAWGVGGYMVVNGQITLGNFYKVIAYLALIYGPLQWFAQVNNWFSRAMAGAERIFEIIDMDKEPYNEEALDLDIRGDVVFDKVRFGYDKSNPVLKDITFTAKAGEMIGLVGKSGAGKSTTINLICRFYDPDSGLISIDGVDARDISLQAMRRQIGVVLQEPFLFNGTVAENIAYGKANASMEEIIEAARAANAHDFIVAKPDGYDTLAGERGAKLSGGERQRISIARAILHDPRILILDEATSSVDVETERAIQVAISRLVQGRTTFAIAHRLSTLRNADRLIVLDRGEIAEMGSHEELMARQGVFYNLVQSQTAINEIIGLA